MTKLTNFRDHGSKDYIHFVQERMKPQSFPHMCHQPQMYKIWLLIQLMNAYHNDVR